MKPAKDESRCSSSEIVPRLAAVAVFLLVVIVYNSTLSCGFFADDYSYLHYFKTMTTSQPQLFWSNFTGLAFQEPLFGNHYRPFLTSALSLLFLVAGKNPAIYHGVVLLLHALNSVLVFCLARFVFSHFQIARPMLCGFFAACLWALYPQHAESLNWFAAGIDPFVCLFILLTFNIFFRTAVDQGAKSLLPLAVVSYAVALGIKEIAWSVPFILVFWCSLANFDSKEARIKALSSTWMFFALLALHLALRYFALGTVGGGYFGWAQAGFLDLLQRWSEPRTLGMLLAPFNESISDQDAGPTICWLYLAAGVLLICKTLFWKEETRGSLRLFCFCLACSFVAILPVVRIWLPDTALTTGRLLYMPSIFFLMPLAFLAGPLAVAADGKVILRKLYSASIIACLGSFVFYFGSICLADNALYVQGSKDLSVLTDELARSTAAENASAVCVANFPAKCSWVPVHWFFCTAQASLSPPFVASDQSARLVATEPVMLPARDLVNATVLKRMIAGPANYRLAVWRQGALNWIEGVSGSADAEPYEIVFDTPKGQQGLSTIYEKVLPQPIRGVDYDLAVLHWRGIPHKDGAAFRWQSAGVDNSLSVYPGKSQASVAHLDEIASWTLATSIDKIKVEAVGFGRPELQGLTLLNSAGFVPHLAPPDDCELLAGCVYLKNGAGERTMTFSFDARSIPAVDSILVEVLPPFGCQAAISGTYRDSSPSPGSYYTFVVNSNHGKFQLSSLKHPLSAWYQVRIFGRKADGTLTGYASDPVSFQFCRQGVLGLK